MYNIIMIRLRINSARVQTRNDMVNFHSVFPGPVSRPSRISDLNLEAEFQFELELDSDNVNVQ